MDAYITLTGNVGSEVDLNSGDGWQFARFRLACTPRIRRQGEWLDGATTWLGVSCQGRLAGFVKESVNKGDPVIVVGKLRTHTWQDDQDEHREMQVVEAQTVGHDLSRGTAVFTKPVRVNGSDVGNSGKAWQSLVTEEGEDDFGEDESGEAA